MVANQPLKEVALGLPIGGFLGSIPSRPTVFK